MTIWSYFETMQNHLETLTYHFSKPLKII